MFESEFCSIESNDSTDTTREQTIEMYKWVIANLWIWKQPSKTKQLLW